MTFPYTSNLGEITPSYPGEVFAPHDFRNEDLNGVAVSESFTVPASADAEGRYRLNLGQVPLQQSGLVLSVDSEARTLIPYGEAPAAGEVAVSMVSGAMEFHASDAGLGGTSEYTGRGTPIMAHLLNTLGAELKATQEGLDSTIAGLGAVAGDDIVPIGRGGTGATTASGARTALGTYSTAEVDGLLGAVAGAIPTVAPDTVTLFVSATDGDDGNAGTYNEPLATFGAAYAAAVALGVGCAIVLGPGSYDCDAVFNEYSTFPTHEICVVGAGRGTTSLHLIRAGSDGVFIFSGVSGVTATSEGAVDLAGPGGYGIGLIESVVFVTDTGSPITVIGTALRPVLADCDVSGTGGFYWTGIASDCRFSGSQAIGSADSAARDCTFTNDGNRVLGAGMWNSTFSGTGTCSLVGTIVGCDVRSTGDVTISAGSVVRSSLFAGMPRITISTVDMRGCEIDVDDMTLTFGSSSKAIFLAHNTIRLAGGIPTNATFPIFIGGDNTAPEIAILNNVITYSGAFGETTTGHVAVIGREEYAGVLRIENTTIEATCIGLMDSHPVNDSSRTSQVRPTVMTNNKIKCVLPAGDGPADRLGCVVRFGGGAFVTSGNVFEMDSSANTREDFDHICVWLHSTGLSGPYASSWVSMRDTFRLTAPNAALDANVKKQPIRFADTTDAPSSIIIRDAIMDLKDTDGVVDTIAPAAPGSWFVADFRVTDRAAGTVTQYVNAVAVGSWTAAGDLSMGAGAQILADDGELTAPGFAFRSAPGYGLWLSSGNILITRGSAASQWIWSSGGWFGPTGAAKGLGSPSNASQQFTQLNMTATGEIRFNGVKVLGAQQAAIADASTSHTVASWADVEAALNALGTKINADLAMERAHGLIAT